MQKTIEELRLVSSFIHFKDEKSGKKPYTIREFNNMPPARRERIKRFMRGEIDLMIIITKGYTSKNIANLCTHALFWKDDVILAWHPEGGMHDV